MIDFLLMVRAVRRSRRVVRYSVAQVQEIARNASAYGWEIGAGAPMDAMLPASPSNPFLSN